MSEAKPFVFAAWGMVALLVIAMAGAPYGYYQFLRLCITVGSAACAYFSLRNRRYGWLVFFVTLALLFNPVLPVEMTRDEWRPFDFAAATGILIFAIIANPSRPLWRRLDVVALLSLVFAAIIGIAIGVAILRFQNAQSGATELNIVEPMATAPSLAQEDASQSWPGTPLLQSGDFEQNVASGEGTILDGLAPDATDRAAPFDNAIVDDN